MHVVGMVPCGASATEQLTQLVSRALHTGHHSPTSAGALDACGCAALASGALTELSEATACCTKEGCGRADALKASCHGAHGPLEAKSACSSLPQFGGYAGWLYAVACMTMRPG